MSRCAKWILLPAVLALVIGLVGAFLVPLLLALGPEHPTPVPPIESTPTNWHAHPATLGYGYAAGTVVLAVALVVGGASRLVDWLLRPRRRRG